MEAKTLETLLETMAEQDELEKKVFETAKEDWEFIHDKLVAIYNKLKDKIGAETTDRSSLGGTAYLLCDFIEEARDIMIKTERLN